MTIKDAAVAIVAASIAGASYVILNRDTAMPINDAMKSGYGDVMRVNGYWTAFRDEKDGGRTATIVDHSPCGKSKGGDCKSTFPGIPTVLGNVMQPGTFSGIDCIEVPCVIQAGDTPP